MLGTPMALALLVATAPVPAVPPAPSNGDREKAREFARVVWEAAEPLATKYMKPVAVRDLMRAAARGLYEECGLTEPEGAGRAFATDDRAALETALAGAHLRLTGKTQLQGPRALFAALNGFRHATDDGVQLTGPRAASFASVGLDYGIGIELEGATGARLLLYEVEHRTAPMGRGAAGRLEPMLPADRIAAPAALPWRVRRVHTDSPAARAGVKPGDVITHVFDKEVTARTADELYREFAFVPPGAGTGTVPLTVRTGTGTPRALNIKNAPYAPLNAFGVMRTDEDKWDCLLDRERKIGYLRVGAVEQNLDEKVGEMLADLERRGCRALILDLRWCPGGYTDPAERIAAFFLRENALLYKLKFRENAPGYSDEVRAGTTAGRYTKWPVAVLVGPETAGTGELIASALRDNDRCVLIGQRTYGRALIYEAVPTAFGGLHLKATTGESLRPNGKPRQRWTDSGPLDDWGLRPDEGLDVPVTRDKMRELQHWADLHALRPADSTEALEFDDPLKDPFRSRALEYLKEKLGPPKKK
jgi:carboxyl-terminal processing protease